MRMSCRDELERYLLLHLLERVAEFMLKGRMKMAFNLIYKNNAVWYQMSVKVQQHDQYVLLAGTELRHIMRLAVTRIYDRFEFLSDDTEGLSVKI